MAVWEEPQVKQFMKDMWVSAINGFWGKVLVVLVAVIGFQTITGIFPSESSKISGGNESILGIVGEFLGSIALYLPMILMFSYWLLTEKIQSGITKERNRDDADIKKVELQKKILELELQKENLRTPPKDGEN